LAIRQLITKCGITEADAVTHLAIASIGLIDTAADAEIVIARPGWGNGSFSIDGVIDALPGRFREARRTLLNDTTAFAIAEARFGAHRQNENGRSPLAFIRIGDGINAGIAMNGGAYRGGLHPELGHIYVPGQDAGEGRCPFHKGCVEGRIGLDALRDRFGVDSFKDLWVKPERREAAVSFIADHLAYACMVLIATFSPERIVLGPGPVSAKRDSPVIPELVKATQKRMLALLAGYPRYGALNSPTFVTGSTLDAAANMRGVIDYALRTLS